MFGVNPDGFPVSYVLGKWLRAKERRINRSADKTLLLIRLNKFMQRRPFTKSDYQEIYKTALETVPHELQALDDTGLFTKEELLQFDIIVQENLDNDSRIDKIIKDNIHLSGMEILELLQKDAL